MLGKKKKLKRKINQALMIQIHVHYRNKSYGDVQTKYAFI